ncbi:MAG TPA: NrtA/SsuA/CpmA family ABC transporter substrate-binding protein [Hanamia sp.]|nr:NrtA/SsuA/CpmA family ABC transporter substrate-binding protein [Hanamia sp.]
MKNLLLNKPFTLCVFFAFFLLPACKQSANQQSADSAKEATATKINITVPQTAYSIPTIIAIEKGFFKENGLDVRVNYVKTGKIAMDDLLAGKADFSNIVETNVAFAGFNNARITILCNFEKVYDGVIVARRDKGITKPQDLKGKKLGIILATTSQVFADRFLEKHGIADADITTINLLPPALQSGIIEGSGVDAISLWQPFVYNVQKALGKNAITFADRQVFTGYMNLAGKNEFIKNNPDAVANLLKGYQKAEQFLATNKAESTGIIARVLNLNKTVVESIWDQYDFNLSMNKELLNATVTEGNWIIKTQKGFEGKKLPDYTRFFDSAYLRKIDASKVNW